MSDPGGLKKVVENSEDMAAIGKILGALEGMQTQLATLTDIVIDLDKRIGKLEKAGRPKLISSRS